MHQSLGHPSAILVLLVHEFYFQLLPILVKINLKPYLVQTLSKLKAGLGPFKEEVWFLVSFKR